MRVNQLPLPLDADIAPAGPPAGVPDDLRASAGPTSPGPQPSVAPVAPVAPPAEAAIVFVRRRGTRRYILRVLDDGSLRVTVPWWGSKREARAFVASQQDWITRQRVRRASSVAGRWTAGSPVLVDGEPYALAADPAGAVVLAGQTLAPAGADARAVRAAVHAHLRSRARQDLPGQLLALAATHGLTVTRVAIRNQVSRWGSCSRQGAISLNWRLVQTPPFVREYVLLHELMHRRELNHSARFWRLVAAACPRYLEARKWLRVEGAQLFD